MGPDAAHVYWNWGHSLLGFTLFAIPLSLFYSYMSRFSLRKSGRFVDLFDDGIRAVNWKNAFYATVAGGISHRMIDFLFHAGHHQGLSPWFDLTLDDLVAWAPAGRITPWIVLDMALIIFMILGGWYALRDGFTKAVKFLLIMTGVFVLAAAVSLLEVTGGESDLGVIFFAFVYILVPLLLVGH
nr:hypothetical protein [Candidatus Sigynarchaeota archaeon]